MHFLVPFFRGRVKVNYIKEFLTRDYKIMQFILLGYTCELCSQNNQGGKFNLVIAYHITAF